MVRGRYTGKWGFPKGKKEGCETELEGALREVEEEVGVWNLGEPVGRFKGTGNQVYFMFHVDDYLPLRPLDIMEVAETRWVTLEDMTTLDTNQGVKSFLKWIHRENKKTKEEKETKEEKGAKEAKEIKEVNEIKG
jgi:8-oxo-dGTP pyrophosphatase MutT (NUDIX family)